MCRLELDRDILRLYPLRNNIIIILLLFLLALDLIAIPSLINHCSGIQQNLPIQHIRLVTKHCHPIKCHDTAPYRDYIIPIPISIPCLFMIMSIFTKSTHTATCTCTTSTLITISIDQQDLPQTSRHHQIITPHKRMPKG